MQYQLLTDERPDALTGKVNQQLQQGWELHGGTHASSCGTNLHFSQAVVLLNPTPESEVARPPSLPPRSF